MKKRSYKITVHFSGDVKIANMSLWHKDRFDVSNQEVLGKVRQATKIPLQIVADAVTEFHPNGS